VPSHHSGNNDGQLTGRMIAQRFATGKSITERNTVAC